MTPKRFRRFLERDGGCVHCGEDETVSPHHRANRGMGGSKQRDVASNIVVICSAYNSAMESSGSAADKGREFGWKLRPWENPAETPVYYATLGAWFLLDDDYNKQQQRGNNDEENNDRPTF